jgi:S1-C subfamily serine protease
MVKAQYLGRGKREYTNPRTNETGHEMTLQALLPDGVVIVRVSDHVYANLAGLKQGDAIVLNFGFEEARFGGHYPVIASVQTAAA